MNILEYEYFYGYFFWVATELDYFLCLLRVFFKLLYRMGVFCGYAKSSNIFWVCLILILFRMNSRC